MTISYGNAEEGSQGHTGTQLRVAAYGPHAANVVGLTDQTDLFFTMRDAWASSKPEGSPFHRRLSFPPGRERVQASVSTLAAIRL